MSKRHPRSARSECVERRSRSGLSAVAWKVGRGARELLQAYSGRPPLWLFWSEICSRLLRSVGNRTHRCTTSAGTAQGIVSDLRDTMGLRVTPRDRRGRRRVEAGAPGQPIRTRGEDRHKTRNPDSPRAAQERSAAPESVVKSGCFFVFSPFVLGTRVRCLAWMCRGGALPSCGGCAALCTIDFPLIPPRLQYHMSG
jgi:hypothetical protein